MHVTSRGGRVANKRARGGASGLSQKDARDTTNFDPEFTREPAQITPTETSLTAADQEEFRGFSYVAEWTVRKESAV